MPLLADAEITLGAWQAVTAGALTLAALVAAAFWEVPVRWRRGRRKFREEQEKDAQQEEDQRLSDERRRDAETRNRIDQLQRDADECRRENAAMRGMIRRLNREVASLNRRMAEASVSTESPTEARWEKDNSGRYLKVNDLFLRIVDAVGGDRSNVIGRNDTEVFGAYTAKILSDMDARAARAPGGVVAESNVPIHPTLTLLSVTKQRCLPIDPNDSQWVAFRGWAIYTPDGGSKFEIPQAK